MEVLEVVARAGKVALVAVERGVVRLLLRVAESALAVAVPAAVVVSRGAGATTGRASTTTMILKNQHRCNQLSLLLVLLFLFVCKWPSTHTSLVSPLIYFTAMSL